jgi:spore coat polysaccharide biosynthesis protein SpsF
MAQRKKVIACVPARLESTRLPGKVLMDMHGYPMNQWLVERLKSCEMIDEIVMCTPTNENNKKIRDAADSWGVKHNDQTNDDILAGFLHAADTYDGDIILRVTGDNIYTDPQYLDVLVKAHIDTQAEYSRIECLPVGVTAEAMSIDMARHLHRTVTDPNETNYMLLYSFNPDVYKCCVVEPLARHNRPFYSLTVDTQEDWDLVETIIAETKADKWGPDIDQIIEWLDNNPDKRKQISPETEFKIPYGKTRSYQLFLDDFAAKKLKSTVVQAETYFK